MTTGSFIFLPLFQALNSEDSFKLRHRLYAEISKIEPNKLNEDQEKVLNTIINQLDFLGFVTENKLLDFQLVASFYYGTIIRCWQNAQPFILYQRDKRKTKFASYFEILNMKCVQYREIHRREENVHTYDEPMLAWDEGVKKWVAKKK